MIFNFQFLPATTEALIHVLDPERRDIVYTMDASTTNNIRHDPDYRQISVELSHQLEPAKKYYVTIPKGMLH